MEGPWLSTTGKKKTKRKFRTAEQARRAREQAESWQAKLAEWDRMSPNFSGKKVTVTKTINCMNPVVKPTVIIDPKRDTSRYPSVDTGAGVAPKIAPQFYTGTKMKGIGTMHKSNSIPIFSDEEAEAIAHMRR
jgi:hypothetical protein